MRASSRYYGAMHHEYVTGRQPMDIPSWQSHCFYQMNGGRPSSPPNPADKPAARERKGSRSTNRVGSHTTRTLAMMLPLH